MLAQLDAGKAFSDQYGPYAFGVLAFVVIITTLGILWIKCFKPTLDTLLEISRTHERTTGNIERATERLERMTITQT